jgi:hypothetical protein
MNSVKLKSHIALQEQRLNLQRQRMHENWHGLQQNLQKACSSKEALLSAFLAGFVWKLNINKPQQSRKKQTLFTSLELAGVWWLKKLSKQLLRKLW